MGGGVASFRCLETGGFALAKGEALAYSLPDMKLKRNCAFFAAFLALTILFSLTGCSTALPYQEVRKGDYLYINPFSYKPDSSQEHWEYASSLRERGKLGKARKQFDILLKRWPESAEAPAAMRAVADIYFEEGEGLKAFQTYEQLVTRYYTGIKGYDEILERQYEIALKEMERKRMRWLFGGYHAPERAIPMFRSILQNAPQWERAPEMQYMIGEAYRLNKEWELAVAAYAAVEYRYPGSPFAEKAAFAKIGCLRSLVEDVPYSMDIREQAMISSALFIDLYPQSEYLPEVQQFADELREQAAQHDLEVGEFYETVPRPGKKDSAALYYEKAVDEYGGTAPAATAAERLTVLLAPGPETVVAEAGRVPVDPAAASSVEARPLPERTVDDEEVIEITADRMEYEGDLMVAEGGVAFQQQGASLQADRVTLNPETGEINATGNIVMMREEGRWEGQELTYNYKTREGSFGASQMFFEPVYITASKVERVSTNEFILHDVLMTTCDGESPAIYAKAERVHLVDTGAPEDPYIKAENVTFYAGPVPIFYMPYLQRHFGDHMFTFIVGAGGRLGGFLLSKVKLHPTDWLTSHTHLDLYSKRGLGLGQDFFWKTPNGNGYIKGYAISDNDPYDDDDTAAHRALIDSQRYRIKVGHQEQLGTNTYFVTRLNWLSDPDVIEDFFRKEFEGEANPENFAVLQHSADRFAAGLRADRRLNNFYTTVNRMPEGSFDWYRSQVGEFPFQFESENKIGFYDLLNAETNQLPLIKPADYRAARIDTYNQLFLPLRYRDFLNIIPRAAYRGTWYSDTAVTGDSGLRNIYEFGTLASFKTWKLLTDKSGFYGTGLQHVVEPYADYLYRERPNYTPGELHQFDDIDALDKANEVQFGVRNFLQTKRGAKRIANVVDADLFSSYSFDPLVAGQEFGPLGGMLAMSLTDDFSVNADFEYDWYTRNITPANARMTYVTSDQSEYSFGYRYRDDATGRRSLLTTSAKLFPNAKWSYEFGARYDALFEEWEERRILVNHQFDCLGMGLGFRMDEDDETQFWLQFWLTAFPESALDYGL